MEQLPTSTQSRKVYLIMLVILLSIISIYAVLHFLNKPIVVESVNFIRYRDSEIKANITEVGSGYYALVSKKGKTLRLGIMNESMLNELISSVNSVLKEAKSIPPEEFNSTRINLTLCLKQRSKTHRGANLTIEDDISLSMYLFPNKTLIQVMASEEVKCFESRPLNLGEFFKDLHNWSEYHTNRALNLSWIKLQERGKLPFKYKIAFISINQSSDKPIVITMVWKGCPCQFNPPETFQFSVEELLKG